MSNPSSNATSDTPQPTWLIHSRNFSGSVKSTTLDDLSQKKCIVCQKSFMLRRKLTCQLCLNVFCSDHCTRKRRPLHSDESLPICDQCDEEVTKKEIADEIDSEIQKVSNELRELSEENERLFKEHFNNTAALNNIEMEIRKQEWSAKKEEEECLGRLEAEQSRGVKIREGVDRMRDCLSELSAMEKNMSEEAIETESQAEITRLEADRLFVEKQAVEAQIEQITMRMHEGLSIEQIRKILCVKCLAIVNETLDGRLDTF